MNVQLKTSVCDELSSRIRDTDSRSINKLNIDSFVNELLLNKSDYEIYIPYFCSNKKDRVCLGCEQQFKVKSMSNYPLRPFLEHCIRDCEQYKQLNLIRKCDDCKCLFLNVKGRNRHYRSTNCKGMNVNDLNKEDDLNKPDWAPTAKSTWQCMKTQRKWNSIVSCQGCGRQFKAQTKRNQTAKHYEPAYFKQCFDECEQYKKLNLIQTCRECNRRFLNFNALKQHCTSSGHCYTHQIQKSSIIICRGCFQQFPWKDTKSCKDVFNKHCIEECDDYEKLGLIRACEKCKKLFRNNQCLSVHKHNMCKTN